MLKVDGINRKTELNENPNLLLPMMMCARAGDEETL